jgi:hydrogenase maturation protease
MLSLEPPPCVAPVLVLAIGNPSRGDDALGPLAASRIDAMQLPGVEVLTDFQLQVEHALDLLGRDTVLFIDASVAGEAPFELRELAPAAQPRHTTHSLHPAAVLGVCQQLTGSTPAARILAIRGDSFALGSPLSAAAAARLDAALVALIPVLTAPLAQRDPA